MAIALATMYRTLVAQRALAAQRAAAAAAAAPPAPRPTAISIARQIVTRQQPILQAAPRPSVSIASVPAPAASPCGALHGSCGSSSSAAGAGAPAASAAPSLAIASTSALPAPATPGSPKAAGDPDAAAVPTEETGGPSLLIWILIAVAIWWVVSRERGGRSLW